MLTHKSYDVIVIGGGPGGYTAALFCARSGLSVLVLEKLSPGGQMATTSVIDNYPGFEEGIDGFELGEKMKRSADRFGVDTELAEVTSVDFVSQPKIVKTTNFEFHTKAVILATGALPKELGVENERQLRNRGIAYCATCDGMAYRGKTVIVVGGGNSAAAEALFLSKICSKVYLVHRRNSLRASKSYIDLLNKAENISFVWDSKVVAFLHEKKVTGASIENLKTGEISEIKCDGIFIAIGRIPSTAYFQGQLEMDDNGYIVADETTKTSVPGVFAVGDLRTKPLRQIVTAVADGAVASKYAEEYIMSF